MYSAVQWSTATKTKAGPSATVTVAVMSVPHITSGASVVMGPAVRLRPVRVTRALRGLEVVLPHQPPHPLLRGAPPLNPQLRPHFSVALAMKRRGFEHPTNVGHQDVIWGGADRTAATTRRRRRGRLTPRIHAEAGAVPHAADPRHAIRPTGGDRLLPLIASTSAGPKGRRPPADPPSHTATRSPSAARRSWPAADGGRRPEHPARGSSAPPGPRPETGHAIAEARAAVIPNARDTDFEILPAQQPQHRLALAPGRKPTPTAAPGATDSSTCFLISTLLLRELSRNQVSKKTLGRRIGC